MRKEKLITDNVYHVFNRGVEKRITFLDKNDYLRFVNNLAIFNDAKSVVNAKFRIKEIETQNIREPLVDILAFCLMPNHYHILLSQRKDDGISKFMNKIGVGYTNYFNLKYERVGSLFQGTFKAVLVDEESQFLYVPFYIHSNPLDLMTKNWKERGIKEIKKAMDFLNSYKWSSHKDYSGKSDFTGIINKNYLNEIFVNPENYQKEFTNFMADFDFSDISDVFLDY